MASSHFGPNKVTHSNFNGLAVTHKISSCRAGNMKSRGLVLHSLPFIVLIMSMLSIIHGHYTKAFADADDGRNGSNVPAVYILGDSSVDCGGNTLFYPLLHARLSVYSCNNGSDATLLPQLIAEKIGLSSIRPFYGQKGSIEEVVGGINFGSTLATIMTEGSNSHQSLNQQLRQVSETMQLLKLQLTEDIALQFTKSSIFLVSFGKEDHIDFFLHNSTSQMLSQNFTTILVDQMTNAVRYLYDANARKIICLGVLPLGCTPRIAWESTNHTSAGDDTRNGCVEKVNQLVFEYNRLLEEHVAKLNAELADAQMVFCDVYNGMMEIMNNPRLYGFEDVKSACCGLGLNGAMIGCISMDIACDQDSTHIWWDLFNPTEAVNSILADAAWSGLPISNLCHPMTIHELVNMKP